MKPIPVNLESWNRRELYEHYHKTVPCGYSMTANLSVGELLKNVKEKGIKFYPAMLYLLMRVCNRHEEFRMVMNEEGNPAVWPQVVPSFTVFHPEWETFSCLWCPYEEDFSQFYQGYQRVMEEFGNRKEFVPQPDTPPNTVPVSMIPWVSYTGFHLHLPNSGNYFAPIFTVGRYQKQGEEWFLPLTIQVHHAVCDGFHTARLFEECQQLAKDSACWLQVER